MSYLATSRFMNIATLCMCLFFSLTDHQPVAWDSHRDTSTRLRHVTEVSRRERCRASSYVQAKELGS
ncbi:hypothetical protein Sjap_013888 [Stephania japonica]|uniref:Secreted protein n=1 Tax=Stephania japonica TaxID=461633 RepID=A0AAP0P1Q9_9MAGN